LRRHLRNSLARNLLTSTPPYWSSPDVGFSSAASSRTRVDLPQPDSPTMPSDSPLRSTRSTPSTARTTTFEPNEKAGLMS